MSAGASSGAPPRAAVLFVDHATNLGGAQHVLLNLLRDLDRRWLTPHVATQSGALADAARELGVRVHEASLPRLRHLMAPWRLIRGAAVLRQIIDSEAITLVHANTARASLYAVAALRARQCALVWHVHDIFEPGWYVRSMCRRADVAIAVSAAAAAALPCASKVYIVHNGVHAEHFSRDPSEEAANLRRQWGVPSRAILVGQVARLQPWKGQRDVIAAASLLQRDRDDVYFAIVGGDVFDDAAAYAAELRATVREQNLERHVILAGHQDDVAAVLSAVDIVVHASDREPFGMALIEAGASGRPVVAYDSGGVAEIVQHERTGLLVRPNDPVALAEAIRRLIENPTLARSLGDQARADVHARFDAKTHVNRIETVYRQVLAD
jgi:glycosyltransferase involved in cell wall biosynthesis